MKKIITSLIILPVGLVIIYFSIFLIQNFTLKKSVSQDYGDNIVFDGDIRDFIRCNINIFKPEFAYLYKIGETADADFYKPKHLLSQTKEDWETSYTGGTTIENTTFPELVAMVKEDCYQFQQSKGNHTDETINWSYSEYTPEPEPEILTPEQQAIKERWELGKELRLELGWMTEEEQKYVEEKYGITMYSSMDEFLEWHKKAVEDGFFKY